MHYEETLPELNKTAERYKNKAQKELKYCPTCQPYDGGDYIWIMGNETTIDEILNDVGCPEKYREVIAAHLYCPNCGNAGFEQYEVAGTEDKFIIEEERQYEEIISKFSNKLQELRSNLELFPSLALAYPMGRKIRKEIIASREESIEIQPREWSRARIVKHSQVYDQSDMTAPGVGLSSGGRFHHQGQSVLYLAEDDAIAMNETLDNPEVPSLIWIQKYTQNNNITDILDLRHQWGNFGQTQSDVLQALLASRYIFEKVNDRSSNWRPQYFLTNFIADCAREAGFKGIIYSSSRTVGSNLVLFNPDEPAIETTNKPKIFIYEPKKNSNDDLMDLTSLF